MLELDALAGSGCVAPKLSELVASASAPGGGKRRRLDSALRMRFAEQRGCQAAVHAMSLDGERNLVVGSTRQHEVTGDPNCV